MIDFANGTGAQVPGALDKGRICDIFGNKCTYGNYYKSTMILNKSAKIKQRLISAKEIVRKYNISYQTVNHYTNFGLISVIFKEGNVRMYDRLEVKKRLVKISQLASEGYSLNLIRKKLVGI